MGGAACFYAWASDGRRRHRLRWVEVEDGRTVAVTKLAVTYPTLRGVAAEVERRNCGGAIVPPTADELVGAVRETVS